MVAHRDKTGLLVVALALGSTIISSYALPQRETTTIRYHHNSRAKTHAPKHTTHQQNITKTPLTLLEQLSAINGNPSTNSRYNYDLYNVTSRRASKAPKGKLFEDIQSTNKLSIQDHFKLKVIKNSSNISNYVQSNLADIIVPNTISRPSPHKEVAINISSKLKLMTSTYRPVLSTSSTPNFLKTTPKRRKYDATKTKYDRSKPTQKTPVTKASKKKIYPIRRKVAIKRPPIQSTKQQYQQDYVYPMPNPEVTSYSPQYEHQFPFPYPANEDIIIDSVETSSNGQPSPEFANPLSNIGSVDLHVIPDSDDCPSYHVNTNVFPNQQYRQDCPDLNLVVNSHLQQNHFTERIPTAQQADGVAAEAAGDELANPPVADAPPPAPAAVQQAPAAAAPAPAGGSGGWPQFPMLPDLPTLPSLPDFKGLLGLLGILWNGLRGVFGILTNPILLSIPVIVFTLTTIGTFIALFPWWLPALFFIGKGGKNKDVVYHKHMHKKIMHPDGWFWNHNTKTWTNIQHMVRPHFHHRMRRIERDVLGGINSFSRKYDRGSEVHRLR